MSRTATRRGKNSLPGGKNSLPGGKNSLPVIITHSRYSVDEDSNPPGIGCHIDPLDVGYHDNRCHVDQVVEDWQESISIDSDDHRVRAWDRDINGAVNRTVSSNDHLRPNTYIRPCATVNRVQSSHI